MTTSIGIALFDEDVITENLLVNADLAMYAAKDAGGNRFEVSEDDGEHLSGMQARLGWVDQIRRGLDEDRFVLYCQPILHLGLQRGHPVGAAPAAAGRRRRDDPAGRLHPHR